MNPRIYTYKITFEEVPYYYYGVHKEKRFDEYYMGSPVTHKWCWEFYTPKKQILELFEYSDEGWMKAQEVEDRLIAPFFNSDNLCLNENRSGFLSLKSLSKGGKIGSKINREMGIGLHGMNQEEKLNARKKGGQTSGKLTKQLKLGIFAISEEERKRNSSIGGKISSRQNKENGVGIFALTKEQMSENSRKAAKETNKQKWKCLKTGYITTCGPLTLYQKRRGIDTSLRERVE